MDYELDHIHYCSECKHWFGCKQSEPNCKLRSKSISDHIEHVECIIQMSATTLNTLIIEMK